MLLLHQRVEVIFALHVSHPPCPHISIQVAARQESIFFSFPFALTVSLSNPRFQAAAIVAQQ